MLLKKSVTVTLSASLISLTKISFPGFADTAALAILCFAPNALSAVALALNVLLPTLTFAVHFFMLPDELILFVEQI
jgi:hypothetical protein